MWSGFIVIKYADDILNLSKSLSQIEENYTILCEQYTSMVLEFNASKSEVGRFSGNRSYYRSQSPVLGDNVTEFVPTMRYLNLPISPDLKSTRAALLKHF